jgi:predicted nucleic acid-binding protein
MVDSPKRIGWEACTWIALIQKEKILDDKGNVIEDRYALARSVIELAAQGKVEIAISGLCLAEVSKNPPDARGIEDKVGPFFEHDYILVVSVDKQVGTIARNLMREGHGLKPPDAVHLATAIVANVDELHSFDDRLLGLDEKLLKLDGTALKICKPAHGGKPMPLLDGVEKASDPKLPEFTDASKPEASAKEGGQSKEQVEVSKPADTGPKIPAAGAGTGVRPETDGARPADETAGKNTPQAPQAISGSALAAALTVAIEKPGDAGSNLVPPTVAGGSSSSQDVDPDKP